MKLLRRVRIASTQDAARRLAEAGAPAGTVVWALRQTRGRGREDRRWASPAGGLYFSLIERPRLKPAALARLSLRIGSALAAALRRRGVDTRVKRPNDVLARTPVGWRKLAGILIEARSSGADVDWVVIGVGVNVNNAPPLESAASLRELTGRTFALEPLLREAVRAVRSAQNRHSSVV